MRMDIRVCVCVHAHPRVHNGFRIFVFYIRAKMSLSLIQAVAIAADAADGTRCCTCADML